MASDTLVISIEAHATHEVEAHVQSLLVQANTEFNYPYEVRSFHAVLRGNSGTIEGGMNAKSYWGWLYISELVVNQKWRGRGYGKCLLASAEAWALDCSCHDAWLSTLSALARGFYENAGYRVFGELPNFPGPQTRFFMHKAIGAAAAAKE